MPQINGEIMKYIIILIILFCYGCDTTPKTSIISNNNSVSIETHYYTLSGINDWVKNEFGNEHSINELNQGEFAILYFESDNRGVQIGITEHGYYVDCIMND